MKASELMIGDWVYNTHNRKPEQVCEIRERMVMLDYNDLYDYDEIEPIPLTAEILERNGFEAERNVGYVYNDWNETEVIFDTFDHRLRILYRRDVVLDIEEWDFPVHMLQHALRLCGVDKEIKLEEK